jgi:hypothetical protein
LRRADFDHLIASAAIVVGQEEIVVVGSQAILGNCAHPPGEMLKSIEADLYPRRRPERSEEIDGSLGDGSPFHRAYGVFAHGVGPESVKGPPGWEERLIVVDIPPRPGSKLAPVAYCMEVHDLVLAKCVAHRDRDWAFAAAAISAGLVRSAELLKRAEDLPIGHEHRAALVRMLEATIERCRGDG